MLVLSFVLFNATAYVPVYRLCYCVHTRCDQTPNKGIAVLDAYIIRTMRMVVYASWVYHSLLMVASLGFVLVAYLWPGGPDWLTSGFVGYVFRMVMFAVEGLAAVVWIAAVPITAPADSLGPAFLPRGSWASVSGAVTPNPYRTQRYM